MEAPLLDIVYITKSKEEAIRALEKEQEPAIGRRKKTVRMDYQTLEQVGIQQKSFVCVKLKKSKRKPKKGQEIKDGNVHLERLKRILPKNIAKFNRCIIDAKKTKDSSLLCEEHCKSIATLWEMNIRKPNLPNNAENHKNQASNKRLVMPKKSCEVCQECFSTTKTLERHKYSFHVPAQCKVDGCDEIFEGRRLRRIHEKNKHSNARNRRHCSCSVCGKLFGTKSGLRRHLMNKHNISKEKNSKEKKLFVCPVCEKTFIKQKHLTCHDKVHKEAKELPFPCSLCTKSFKTNNGKRKHQRKIHHNGGKTSM